MADVHRQLFDTSADAADQDAARRSLDELFSLAHQYKSSQAYFKLLQFIARFRFYSPFNAMLVHLQSPGATYVASPHRWARDYSRRIKAGARPLVILQPRDPVMFVFDVSDTEPEKDARPLPPEALEPGRITYRVLVELEHQPVSFKTGEMSFGKKYQYDKKYLDAYSLGRELNLSPDRLEIEHLEHTRYYRVKSLVAYHDEQLALMQAQQLWEQSKILEQYKSGQVIHAHYGLQEVETGYLRVAGVCCSAEDKWAIPQTRAEYMAEEALECTLAYALDVNAYRAHAGMRRRWLSDDDLLYRMHRRRAKCSAIPVEARRESEVWLLGHPDDLRHD